MDKKEVDVKSQTSVRVGNNQLELKDVRVPADEVTGKEILLAYGVEDLDKYSIYQWLHGGPTVRLNIEDDAKPDDGGSPWRFVVFKGLVEFEFELDGSRFEWGADRISGKVLKLLAGLDPAMYAVWREREKGEDDEIENNDWSRLDEAGPVVFFTGRQETTEGGSTI